MKKKYIFLLLFALKIFFLVKLILIILPSINILNIDVNILDIVGKKSRMYKKYMYSLQER